MSNFHVHIEFENVCGTDEKGTVGWGTRIDFEITDIWSPNMQDIC